MLPTIARGDANKVWIVPSELNDALKGLGSAVGSVASAFPTTANKGDFQAPDKIDVQQEISQRSADDEAEAQRTMQDAIEAAQALSQTGRPSLRLPQQTAVTAGPNGASVDSEQDQPQGEPNSMR
jgi:hypothetical protein